MTYVSLVCGLALAGFIALTQGEAPAARGAVTPGRAPSLVQSVPSRDWPVLVYYIAGDEVQADAARAAEATFDQSSPDYARRSVSVLMVRTPEDEVWAISVLDSAMGNRPMPDMQVIDLRPRS